MLKLGKQGAQVEQVDGSLDFSGFGSRCWESVRVTHGTGMGRKCFVCAAEHGGDSGEDESSRCDNKADGAFPAHPAGRRAFRPPSAAQLLGVPSASGMPSSPLLDGGLKSGRRSPSVTRTGSLMPKMFLGGCGRCRGFRLLVTGYSQFRTSPRQVCQDGQVREARMPSSES